MNALTHRDYSAFDGGMSVGVYPDRIEIWNSGHLPSSLKPSALAKPHPSLPPNPDIAHVFYLRGLIERIGRGTVKIVEECRAAKLPTPKWTVDGAGVTLTIRGPQVTPAAKLNSRQRELAARLKPGTTLVPSDYYAEMKEKVKLSQRALQRDLSGLESGGWLSKVGEGPATVYVRTEKAAP
ncbi:MAG: ATP-binding protein [Pirellulales bacterium]